MLSFLISVYFIKKITQYSDFGQRSIIESAKTEIIQALRGSALSFE